MMIMMTNNLKNFMFIISSPAQVGEEAMLPGARPRVAVDQDAPLQADQHQRGEHDRSCCP